MSRTRFVRVATVGLLVLLTLGSLVAGSAVAVAAGTGDAVPGVTAAQDDEGGMDNESDDGMNESDGMDDDSGMDNSSDDGMNDSGGMDDDGEMNDEMNDEMSDEMDDESALGNVELIALGLVLVGSVGAVGYYFVSN